jgi:hypothetical protein
MNVGKLVIMYDNIIYHKPWDYSSANILRRKLDKIQLNQSLEQSEEKLLGNLMKIQKRSQNLVYKIYI